MKPRRQHKKNDYLSAQAQNARAAISRTIGDMKESAARALDVPAWARTHPWAVVGVATAIGVVAGAAGTAALQRAFRQRTPEYVEYVSPEPRRRRAIARAGSSLAGFLAGTLGSVLRTVVQSSITAATAATVAKEMTEDDNPPSPAAETEAV
jgi:hypothetical protein